MVNSFFLAMAIFAAPGGRLGDFYGHRRVLLIALAIFAAGSLSAAVSQGFVWLVVSIGIAGMGASTLYPSSAAMIANRVPQEHRGDALGKYSAIGVTVLVIGPVLAGLMTEAFSWRAMFGLQMVVALGPRRTRAGCGSTTAPPPRPSASTPPVSASSPPG